MIQVIPAVNTSLLSEAKRQIALVESFSDRVDVDIADGVFTSQKTISLRQLSVVRTKAVLSVHYMGVSPLKVIALLPKGVVSFAFHFEVLHRKDDLKKIFSALKKRKIRPVIALGPSVSVKELGDLPKKHRFFHLVTVHPGKSGQKLLRNTLKKSRELFALNPKVVIGVDGGVHKKDASFLKKFPLRYVCATSEIFAAKDPRKAFVELERELNV